MLQRIVGSRGGRILVVGIVFVALFLAGEAAAGNGGAVVASSGSNVWQTFGNILCAAGGAAVALMAMRSHIANRSIHQTPQELDRTYLRKDSAADHLRDEFVPRESCELIHQHTIEALEAVKSGVDRMETKLDALAEKD
jgi:hypothetical protein